MAKAETEHQQPRPYHVFVLYRAKSKLGYMADYTEQEWFATPNEARQCYQEWRAKYGPTATSIDILFEGKSMITPEP